MPDEEMNGRRWSDSVILSMNQQVGKINGQIEGLERSSNETRKDVKEILKSVAVIPEMQRMIIQHDKRIGDLEQKSVAHDVAAARIEEHLRTDEPAERYIDRGIASWVRNGLWVALAGFITWLVARVTGKGP